MFAFRKLFGKRFPSGCKKAAVRRRQPRLEVQQLEDRLVPTTLAVTSALAPAGYVQTNLVSNIQGMALVTDPRLVNPWDVNFPQLPGINPPVVVADQGTGVATSYQISSNGRKVIASSVAVTIPTVGSSALSGPTGVVQNTNPGDFLIPGPDGNVPATYIFDTLQGTIEGYSASNTGVINSAEIMVNNSPTAEYTGLATGIFDGQDYIYAANEGTHPGIQVFNSSFQQVPLGPGPVGVETLGNFIDPSLPAGFMPYGVRDLSLGVAGGKQAADLFVTYRGPNFQGGAVAVFNNGGEFLGQIASDKTGGNLQSPWGLAYIGQNLFGDVGGDLLVGNFSSGQIDAYQVTLSPTAAKGQFLGPLLNANGTPLTIPGLRSIHFGPGLGDSGHTHVALLFTAETDILTSGIDSGNLSLYGMITPTDVGSAPPLAANSAKSSAKAAPATSSIADPLAISGSVPAYASQNGTEPLQFGASAGNSVAILEMAFATLASQPEAELAPEMTFGASEGLQSLESLRLSFEDLDDLPLAPLRASLWPAN